MNATALFSLTPKIKQENKQINPKNPFIQPGDFTAVEEPIAQLIQRRRLQMLVHSRLYYELDDPLITDAEFDKRAKELVKLQAQYPEIAARVCYAKAFEGWDGSTGAFLPLNDAWAVKKANELIKIMEKQNEHTKIQQQTRETSRQSVKRKGTAGQRVNPLF